MGSQEHVIALAPTYIVLARRLIEREMVTTLDERVAAARTIETIFGTLVPYVGALGVLALFARSARIASRDCPSLSGLSVNTSSLETTQQDVRSHFASMVASDVIVSATSLCATFITLITTFIGEDLTLQLIRQQEDHQAP